MADQAPEASPLAERGEVAGPPRSWHAGGTVLRVLVFLLAAWVAGGCPHGPQQGTLRLPAVTSDDPEAEAEIRQAREAYDAGDAAGAASRYERFLVDHPEDPLVPVAHLGLGQILLAEGRTEQARPHFSAVAEHEDPEVAERGRFYDGVALHLLGRHRESLETLRPFVGRTVDPVETGLLLRTIAAAAEQEGDRVSALEALDSLVSAPLPEASQQDAREEIGRVVSEATPEEIGRAADLLPRDGVAWPMVARRVLEVAYGLGDLPRVHTLAESLRAQGHELDEELAAMALRAERTSRADPRMIGAILPLSGRGREVGQLALKGLMLGARLPPRGPVADDAPQIVFRDDAGDPERAVRAVEDLVSLHRVIAIVGPLAGPTAERAAQRAQELGVPLITLSASPEITATGPMVFRLFVSPAAESLELVSAARARGAQRFAVLHPESPYGQAMRDAFTTVVRAQGGEMVAARGYEPTATSFGTEIAELGRTPFDAIFIPDSSRKLALIAPALATAGLWSTPAGGRPPTNGHAITILAPSVAFDAQLGRSAGRYLQGALFSSPFHAPTAEGPGRAFADEFMSRYGTAPDAFAAYAFDAYQLVRRAVEGGAETRASVADQLAGMANVPTAGASRGLRRDREPVRGTRILELREGVFVRLGD